MDVDFRFSAWDVFLLWGQKHNLEQVDVILRKCGVDFVLVHDLTPQHAIRC